MEGGAEAQEKAERINESTWLNNARIEYALLQLKIDNYGSSAITLRGISTTVLLAVSAYSLKTNDYIMPTLGLVFLLGILFYEGTNKIYYDVIKDRALELEKAMKSGYYPTACRTPHTAQFLRHPREAAGKSGDRPRRMRLTSGGRIRLIRVIKALLDWREFLLYYIMIVVLLALLSFAVLIRFQDRRVVPNFRPQGDATLAVCPIKGTHT
ncbi:MAG: hypothetical protein ACP5SH_01080 [Syntrophobacteraceae bacterium]